MLEKVLWLHMLLQNSVSISGEIDVGVLRLSSAGSPTLGSIGCRACRDQSIAYDRRSVAGTGEIGVPPYFAMRLSFPERVTPHNVEQLRQARSDCAFGIARRKSHR